MMDITQFYMRCDGLGIQVGAFFFQQGKNIKTLFSFIFFQLIYSTTSSRRFIFGAVVPAFQSPAS